MRTLRRRWLAPVTGVLALAVAVTAYGIGPARAAATTLTVGTTQGPALHDDFIGLSFEASIIAQPALANGNLAQYMKTLGPGVMRFGGNFVDTTFWTSKGEKAPSWAVTTLTPNDLKRLKTLADNSGWKVILGVNLKHPDPARAADEAKFAVQTLGSSLMAIEIGNEPNYYPNYSPAKLFADYQRYRAAIAKTAPGVGLVAPETGSAPAAVTYLQDFAKREQGHVDLAALTTHFYPACAKSGHVSISQLLSPAFHDKIQTRADILANAAGPLHIPAIMDEANSVSCEGQDGTSDVYASALWAVDDELMIAKTGIRGEYFHSAIAKCGAPKPFYKAYTPFCAPTDADAAAGRLIAHPEYYGLLMLQQIGTGNFVSLTNPDTATLRAYAVKNGTRLRLVLDNLSGARTVTIKLDGKYTQGNLLRLSASSLSAKTGITLGGATVASNGTFPGTTRTTVTVSGSTLTLSLPAGTATLVTLNP
jgi:glycosyl hydrolase family 79